MERGERLDSLDQRAETLQQSVTVIWIRLTILIFSQQPLKHRYAI